MWLGMLFSIDVDKGRGDTSRFPLVLLRVPVEILGCSRFFNDINSRVDLVYIINIM